jgi:hypothetical protein
MKNAFAWVVTPRGSFKNLRFGGTYRHHQGDKNRRTRNNMILGTVTLVRTDISEEHIAYIIRVIRIVQLGTMLAINSNRSTLRRKTSYHPDDGGDTFLRNVSSRATRRSIREDGILHCYVLSPSYDLWQV